MSNKYDSSRWGVGEIRYLRSHFKHKKDMTLKEIAKALDRSYYAVCKKANDMNFSKDAPPEYSEEEIERMEEAFEGGEKIKDLAEELDRSYLALRQKFIKMGLTRWSYPPRAFGEIVEDTLDAMNNDGVFSTKDLAEILGIKRHNVRGMMNRRDLFIGQGFKLYMNPCSLCGMETKNKNYCRDCSSLPRYLVPEDMLEG